MDIKLPTIVLDEAKQTSPPFVIIDGIVNIPEGKILRNGMFKKNVKGTTIYFKGEGDIDLLCGNCNSMLAIELQKDSLKGNVIFKCSECGSLNLFENL